MSISQILLIHLPVTFCFFLNDLYFTMYLSLSRLFSQRIATFISHCEPAVIVDFGYLSLSHSHMKGKQRITFLPSLNFQK